MSLNSSAVSGIIIRNISTEHIIILCNHISGGPVTNTEDVSTKPLAILFTTVINSAGAY